MLLFLHLLAYFFLSASAAHTDVSEERDIFSPHIQWAIQTLRSILLVSLGSLWPLDLHVGIGKFQNRILRVK